MNTFNLRRVLTLFITICLLSTSTIANTKLQKESFNKGLGETLTTDLLGAGISVAASLSGNIALALSAGLLTKYITTYGIAGVKKLIDLFKGYEPRDLGEINLYYVYLLNIKRNLYFTLINIRKAAKESDRSGRIATELQEITKLIIGKCKKEENCNPRDFDETLVNYEFLNIAIDINETMDFSLMLQTYEMKATYQYLMLLYLDLIIVEQKLIEAQYDVLASTIINIKNELKKHPFISKEEKEYIYQAAMNIGTRWSAQRAERRVTLATALKNPLRRLNSENDDLEDDLDDYRNREKSLKGNDDYQNLLNKMIKELKEFGISMNVFNQNPFQTGTALKNYYLSEKTLLLQRDTFFQLRANKLENTDQVADFHHRLKVLRSHGSNIYLQLMQALKKQVAGDDVGDEFEEGKHQATLDEILKECAADAACVADRLKNPEMNATNILVENFKFSAQIFKFTPYMHALEVASIYQLVQLIYLEVLYGRIRVSKVEFELFKDKQLAIMKSIQENRNLSQLEKQMHSAVVRNTLNKWKIKIAKRKFDHTKEFSDKSLKLIEFNAKQASIAKNAIDNLPLEVKVPKCKTTIFNSDRKRCKKRKAFNDLLKESRKKKRKFSSKDHKEEKLPEYFWEKI